MAEPRTAILCAGQGAQAVGMGRDLADAFAEARAIFERADALLGLPLSRTCFDGPPETLNATDIAQPAIFVTGAAIAAALRAAGAMPAAGAAAGLSLGEYTALYVAGALSFDDGLRLVRRRGQLMQEACEANPGGMVSVLKLDPERVEALCDEARGAGALTCANYNGPGQIVVSGTTDACQRIAELARSAGGMAVPLTVAGAFHSELMRSAADGLAAELEQVPIQPPAMPVIANVTAEPHAAPASIRRRLAEQLVGPVRWQQSMQRLIADGVTRAVEIGPGRVLAGLMRRIDRRVEVVTVSTADDVAALARNR